MGGRDLLFQAQANLLGDAHKYAPEGKLIHLYGRQGNNHVELAAIDHGHGIPRELHSVALQLSRRLDKGRELPGDVWSRRSPNYIVASCCWKTPVTRTACHGFGISLAYPTTLRRISIFKISGDKTCAGSCSQWVLAGS